MESRGALSKPELRKWVLGGDYSTVNNVPLQRIVRGQLRETAGRMANLSNTTAVSTWYQSAVDEAVRAVQSGVEDYGSAIRKALREAGGRGLRVVNYESGYYQRADTAVRMNILDGVRRLNQSIMEEVGRQFGAGGGLTESLIRSTQSRLCRDR